MAAWCCAGCSTVYSVGAPRCPHCASTDHYEEGQTVGKISKSAGATVAGEAVAEAPVEAPVVEPAEVEAPVEDTPTEPADEPVEADETPEAAAPVKPTRRR